MYPRRSILTALLALLFILGCPPAQARELLAVGAQFPRVFAAGETGQPVGMAVDLLRQAAASQGHQLRFELYPWLRAQQMVEAGQADILIGPYRTPEREARFLFSHLGFYEDALIFYVRRGQAHLWTGDFAALSRHAVGLVQGWAYGEALERARPNLRISSVLNVEAGLQMLKLGRVDLLASNERNTTPVIEQLGLDRDLLPVLPAIGQLRGHFAYTRNPAGEALRLELDRALEQMRAAGELRELGRRWKVRTPD